MKYYWTVIGMQGRPAVALQKAIALLGFIQ